MLASYTIPRVDVLLERRVPEPAGSARGGQLQRAERRGASRRSAAALGRSGERDGQPRRAGDDVRRPGEPGSTCGSRSCSASPATGPC